MPNKIDLSENNLLGRRAIAKTVAPFEPVILPPSPCEDAASIQESHTQGFLNGKLIFLR